MKHEIFYVDAFSNKAFTGNPAAVIFKHFDEKIMQQIAAENNLSETAFIENNHIRWFSPTIEVNLCGHATLASAFVYFNYIDNAATSIEFESASGILKVNKRSNIYELDFPKDNFQQIDAINSIEIATGVKPLETYIGDINMFAVFDRGADIRDIQPNFDEIKNLDGQGLIISSADDEFDFVSRYFCPKYGINEDPVTGSAHTTLIPYWAEKLGKDKLHAKQVSQRGGELFCENLDNRVLIGGEAKIYMRGEIELN